MDHTKQNSKIPYPEKLNKEAKEHYFQEIEELSGIDPYEQKEQTKDLDQLQQVSASDMFVYLVSGVSAYTHAVFFFDLSASKLRNYLNFYLKI